MDKILKTPLSRQCWVTSGVLLSLIGQGCTMGYTAMLLPQLRQDPSFVMSLEEESWIASVVGFALLPGNFITPYVMAKYGRRTANLISTMPLVAGWLMILAAKDIPLMILARTLQGLSMGLTSPVSSISIAEYTSPKNRGYFLTTVSLGYATGILIVQTVGIIINWKQTAWMSVGFPLLSLLVIALSPETPYWLASKGRYDESRKSFRWLRGTDRDEDNDELEVMITARVIERNDRVNHDSNLNNFKSILKTLRKKELLKPLAIVVHLFALVQFAGLNVFASYSIDILNLLVGEGSNPELWMISVDILRLISVVVAAILIRNAKRRTVLYLSGVLSVLMMLALSLCSYLRLQHLLDNTWITIALLYTYTFSVTIGIVPIPFAISGEIFPMEVKSLGNGIGVLIMNCIFFLVIKTAPSLFRGIGFHGTYLLYSGVLFYCLCVLWFTLPETKDRTLQDIENEFKSSNSSKEHHQKEESQKLTNEVVTVN